MNRGTLHPSFKKFKTCTETDELNMALRARKVSGALEKRAPGLELAVASLAAIKRKSQRQKFDRV